MNHSSAEKQRTKYVVQRKLLTSAVIMSLVIRYSLLVSSFSNHCHQLPELFLCVTVYENLLMCTIQHYIFCHLY